jgi:hypothetical protein
MKVKIKINIIVTIKIRDIDNKKLDRQNKIWNKYKCQKKIIIYISINKVEGH